MVKRLSNNCSRKRKQHIMLEEAQESKASHEEHEIGQSGDVYHVALTGTWGRDYGNGSPFLPYQVREESVESARRLSVTITAGVK